MIFPKGHDFVQQAKDNGSMEIADRLFSANHILMGLSSSVMQEIDDIMSRNQLRAGTLKWAWNNYQRASDKYFAEFRKLLRESGQGDVMLHDLQEAEEEFRKWSQTTHEDLNNIRKRHEEKKT